jgi:hypothetical protein
MPMTLARAAPVAAAAALVLAACSTGGFNRSDNSLSAAEIRSILAGKSWRFSGPNNSGVNLYASDGTSLVEVDGKGTTTGKWYAKDGELCESFAPAPFLPDGLAMTCYPFTGSGNSYRAGEATFRLAS